MNMNDKFDPNGTMMINLNAAQRGKFKITFLGVGSAGSLENWQSNVLIEDLNSDRKLLLDAGDDVRHALWDRKLRTRDVTDIYVSHPHGDHIHGLEGIGFDTKWVPNREKTNLYVSKTFASDLWSKSLQLGMGSLEGELADIDNFFNVYSIGDKGRFEWQGLKFQMVQVVHVMNGFGIVPSFGLLFVINGVTVFFTSDTQFAPHQIQKFYDKADVIFHDCETAPWKSGVHAHYDFLKSLDAKTKAKMWLYHYQDGPRADAVADGFQGFVSEGQEFLFS